MADAPVSNVIKFPKQSKDISPKSIDEVIKNIEEFKELHVDEALDIIVPLLFNQISVIGFNNYDVDDPEYDKMVALLIEAIKSFMYKNHGMKHPLQELAVGLFEKDKDGDLNIRNPLQIILRPMGGKDDKDEEINVTRQ